MLLVSPAAPTATISCGLVTSAKGNSVHFGQIDPLRPCKEISAREERLTSAREETSDGLQANGEAEGQEKDGVDEGPEYLSALPAVTVLCRGRLLCELHGLHGDDETAHIVEL